ncbi:hypothetical protein BC833DRAFT_564140 [Globomyces pollinis-pini]|nr:hypothetical protein BC833DRAFT_564140 [Globomyces pollinis-pini]
MNLPWEVVRDNCYFHMNLNCRVAVCLVQQLLLLENQLLLLRLIFYPLNRLEKHYLVGSSSKCACYRNAYVLTLFLVEKQKKALQDTKNTDYFQISVDDISKVYRSQSKSESLTETFLVKPFTRECLT